MVDNRHPLVDGCFHCYGSKSDHVGGVRRAKLVSRTFLHRHDIIWFSPSRPDLEGCSFDIMDLAWALSIVSL